MKKTGGEIWKEGQQKALKNKLPKVVEKDWGREIWMANNLEENYCGKILQINQGYNSSMHFHMEKHETFYITKGSLQVNTIDTMEGTEVKRVIHEGEVLEMPRGLPHQLIAYDGDVEFIEISTYHKDSDSHRIKR
jgi:mannose-6-phosphate isomerase-like protein (cupin superfamily)